VNPNKLLTHFNRISEAPDAIPRLRHFILDLAVRGKLVEQDPREEPASELLKRIQEEKIRLVKAEKNRKIGVEPLRPDEIPFKLPDNWTWTRLGEICSKTGSGSTPRGGKSTYQDQGVPFFRSQNIYNDGLRLDDVVYIDKQTHQRMGGTTVKPADLLLNITGGSIGRCCRVRDDFKEANISQHVAIIRVAVLGIQNFLHRLILSPYFQSFIFDEQTGAGRGGLPKNKMDRIPIVLPPLAEQHRIVAKMDELMALCDRLEAAQRERESQRDRLVASSLHHLNNGADADANAFREHARFYFNHLPRLTTRPDHLKQLRQTILNLAVQGKLVPQNPTDEPVELQLNKISNQKQALIEAKKIRQGKVSRPQTAIAPSSQLPSAWKWVNVDSLCFKVTDGTHFTPRYVESGVRFVSAKDIGGGVLLFDRCKFISQKEHEQLYRRCNPAYHDIVISKSGSIGTVALVEDRGEFSLFESLALLKFDQESLFPKYLVYALNHACSLLTTSHIRGVAVKHLHLDILRGIELSLPPLAEQHRIVAKVDELMALCDQLETQLTTTQTETRHLLDSLLTETLAKQTGKD
jgi:type I restriction enzyme S subunit